MPVDVVAYSCEWPGQFRRVADDLLAALVSIGSVEVEHVGSTSVPGLAAKPVLDIDVIVDRADVGATLAALSRIGYVHRGDLGVVGREALKAPDAHPRRNVYVCSRGALGARNHLTVRDVLRARPDLREKYAAVKLALATDPDIDIDTYIAGKSAVLQHILAIGGIDAKDRLEILRVNDPDARND